MKASEVRGAIRTRDSVDSTQNVFLKYRVKLVDGQPPERVAAQLANSLVSGVSKSLGWFANPFESAVVVDGVACEFVKYPTLRVAGVSEGSVAAGFVGGAGPGVVAGEVDVFPAQR